MPGEVTGTDMREDQSAYEDGSVLDKVTQTLSQFPDKGSTPEPEPTEPAEPTEPTPEPEPEPESEPEPKPAGDDDSTPEPGAEPKPAEPSDQKPAIPDNYYRAAVHQGWKPEQIDKLYQSDPEGTLEFLKQNHENVNNLSQQFSSLGRKARELEESKPVSQPEPTIKVDDFRRAYEEDPAAAIAEALNKVQTAPVVQQQPAKQDDKQADLAAIEQMNNFFAASDMDGFTDFYGTSKSYQWNDLTPGQYANRMAVVNRADEILAGAALLKSDITVRDAVERAHLQITAPIVEKVVREKIVSQVKKKAKGVTLRPGKSKTIVPSGNKAGQLSEQEVEDRARERLEKLGTK